MSAMSSYPDGDKQRGNNPGHEIFKVFAGPSESEMSWSGEAYSIGSGGRQLSQSGRDRGPKSSANKIRLVRPVRTASGASTRNQKYS
jgi:hypothetical protein